jgi:hypothetical protein
MVRQATARVMSPARPLAIRMQTAMAVGLSTRVLFNN